MTLNPYLMFWSKSNVQLPQYPGITSRFCRMRLLATLGLLLIAGYPAAHAQTRWMIYAGAGTPRNSFDGNGKDAYYDYYAAKGADGFYLLPQAGLSLMVPVGKKLLFETGINYTRKQFRLKENKVLDAYTPHQLTVYNSFKTKLDYMELPFTISYILPVSKNSTFQLGVGVNYSFLVHASGSVYSSQTTIGMPTDEYQSSVSVPIGLVQTSNTVPGTLNIFDTGLKLQLSYVWHSKLMVRLFHEYSLYTLYLRGDKSKPDLQLRYTGLTLGYIL